MKQMRLLLTGTPCTGKTTLAQAICRQLDCPLVKVNEFVGQIGCYTFTKEGNGQGVKQVDLKVLQKHLRKLLEKFAQSKESVVLEGHLLSDVRLPCEKIVVLRCDPRALEKRMQKRGWKKAKIAENLLAEMLDYCLLNAEKNYGKKVMQLDFTKPFSAQKALEKILSGKGEKVDWSGQLLDGPLRKRYVF